MQDEALDGVLKLCGLFGIFCHDRNIGNTGKKSREKKAAALTPGYRPRGRYSAPPEVNRSLRRHARA
jgi:hypothetical protein